ncbi:MAG: glycosyltransferase family 4 protein [Bacteroidales bacterium]|nr:glycosyltransferase family 4 protein [Bacteroidales bacterium]
MKIAFIGGRTFHHPDGIATFMFNLATELVSMGHEPVVYQESDHNGEEWVNGFKVVHQKSSKSAIYNKMGLGVKSTFNALFKQNGIDIIHYNCGGPAFFASIWARLFGKKVVLQLHGLEFKRTKYSPFWRFIAKVYFDLYCRMHKHITVCSTEQYEYLIERFGKSSTVITGAVNLPEVVKDTDVLGRFGIKANNYVLFMGRLVQDKNPDCLIQGFINSNYNDKQLVICGCAAPGSNFENELHQLALGCPNIIFTGAIFGDDKDVIIHNAWAYCLPSTIEGLPISLLEAMSYGKICIASDIPANREALGESGIWVEKEISEDITNALNDLYDHYNKYEWQGNANLERVKSCFSWKNKAQQYEDFINKI